MKTIVPRLLALLLWALFLLPHALAPILVLWRILFMSTQHAKDGLRSMDMTTNCLWFAGSPYESLSSHTWREACASAPAWWSRWVLWFTGLFVKDHCKSANAIEQPIVDFVAKQ